MTIKKLLPLVLLCLSFPATADFVTASRAYEVVLRDFRAPATANGAVFFKTCQSCESKSVRVTPATRYIVNGQSVTLQKFRDAIATADRRRIAPVIVLHHLESDTVVSIKLTV